MNILCDRHQADLFRAMQRMFEDRLGFRVWTPMGHEWWDDGVWRFGECFGDDRLAQQYIIPRDGVHTPTGQGQWVTFDTAHPYTPIRCISLDAARSLGDWAFVVATVQENQPGFARFAQEQGARFVVQVGNTGQHIDWDLNPLVISSSEMPLTGRGVVAHQEFDSGPSGAFSFADPEIADRRRVRNFVNLIDRIPQSWDDFLHAERELSPDGFHFYAHGHEGRDKVIQPSSKIADLMAGSGWGWHVKPVGDGFGHVLHGWAAVGRPLVGRSEYYVGKLGEPLWEDLVTCVDLSVHPIDEAIRLVREISADAERHAGMCRAIRARFDSLVDYDRDERRVRELLGLAVG